MLISEYIDLFERELFESCAPFWVKYGFDHENGGITTCLDREGKVYSTDKSVWMQGRCGYMYSRLHNVFPDRDPGEWLPLAKSAIDFATAHCIDTDGRMFFQVTADGRPLRKRRYMFSETFYIIACAEYYKATGDKNYLQRAERYYDFVWNMYLDPSTDPYKITPKMVPGVRDTKALAVPMILLNVTSVMMSVLPKDPKYPENAKKLVKDIMAFRYADTSFMLESVGINGEYYGESASARIINPGHDIELSWFLLDEAVRTGDKKLQDFAEKVFNTAIDFGWDDEYGGILYFKDLEGKPVEAYEHDMKLWWPHNEAVIASLKLYKLTGAERYWDWFERVTDYAFEKFSDFKYGEWYGYLRRDGRPTRPPCKGHTYKGPFHVMRMLTEGIQTLKELQKNDK